MAPPNIEENFEQVYVRGTPVRKSRTDGEGEDAHTSEYWEYDEVMMTKAEYDLAKVLMLNVPDDCWTDGMQTMMRSVRYARTDGPKSKCERNIRLGIDVEANQAKLAEIDAYCEAVRQTKNAPDYPKNVPSYPEEPAL